MSLTFERIATDPSGARRGRLTLTRDGVEKVVETPVFMPVATQATIKTVFPEQVAETGSRILLANSYHLHLKPGDDAVASQGGLHRFMNWPHAIITDSGGYQVFSLPVREMREEGVRFQAEKGGERILLTPEKAVAIQEALGADIAMVLDECVAYPTPHGYAKEAMLRSVRWAKRCLDAAQRPDQALFPIVQGSTYADLRRDCALALADLDPVGIAVGGLSVGEGLDVMTEVLSYTVPHLPEDKPRYLMGVGLPEDILAAVEAGMDMSDCVIPTKYARSGMVFTKVGRLRITKNQYRRDKFPLDTDCGCYACQHYSRAYVHHLFNAGEVLGNALATLHNLHFYQELMQGIRGAIEEGRFRAFKEQFLHTYQRQERKSRHVR